MSATREKTWRAGTLTYTPAALVVLFLWLLWGDFAWSMRDRSVGPMSQWYLNELGIPDLLFGLLFSSLPALIGIVLVPIISVKSDRHRGRFGRRIPFLLVTSPIAALGMIGLALTPFLATWVHGHLPGQSEQTVAVLCFGVFWTVFEIASITGLAIFGGLINDVVPEPLLGRFYGLFRAVSLIDGMIFNYWLMGKVPGHYTLILLVIGVFYGTAFLWVCFKVKEGTYPPPPSPSFPRQTARATRFIRNTKGGVSAYFRECFSNTYYVSVFLMMAFSGVAFGSLNIFSLPYAKNLGMSMDLYGKGLALTYLVSLALAWLLGWLADRFHPLRMAIATLAGYGLVMIAGWLFATSSTSFFIVWVLHGVLCGSYFTSAASLGQRLFPHSKFAQFASAAGILASSGQMLLGPGLGLLIDATDKNYRHTFSVSILLTIIALLIAGAVHVKFMRLGGPGGYSAPEPS
ncbi:Major Facilitator Superfamily transporter [Opitutaceae bacterium TAV1]|nr:Major Facilitator Superfamily transporter [Opitutaceae bacterium TAV1]